MNGATLIALLISFMDDEEISETFAYQLLNMAKDIIEMRRSWMLLRTFDTSFNFASTDGFDDFKTLPSDFLMCYGDAPLKLINGVDILKFRETPIEERDTNKDDVGKFYIYHNQSQFAILGGLEKAYTGSLYYIGRTDDIEEGTTWLFPKFSHPLLVIEALILHRGQVDFDTINARMVNAGLGTKDEMEQVLTTWDARLQTRSLHGRPKGDLFQNRVS